jgi:hypothetical protein
VAVPSQAGHHVVSGGHHDGFDRVDSGSRRDHPAGKLSSEGIDLIGPLQKGTIADRTLFWRLPAPPNAAGAAAQRAVRRGNWKYLEDRGQNFLYDLRSDPGEQHDVAQSHIALWQELRGLANKWEADVDAEARQRATPKASAANQGSAQSAPF